MSVFRTNIKHMKTLSRNASKALPVAKNPATPSTVLHTPTRARLLATLPPKNMLQKRWSSTSSRRFSDISPGPLSQTIFKGNVVEHNGNRSTPFLTRAELKQSKRVVIKMGSAVITRADGQGLALGRLAAIIEQIAEIQNQGRECIVVTSGAVAFGKQKLGQELLMSMSMRETLSRGALSVDRSSELKSIAQHELKRPNAAVGQSGLMALYEAMFRNYGLIVGQVLVTKQDFINDDTREQLFNTIRELM